MAEAVAISSGADERDCAASIEHGVVEIGIAGPSVDEKAAQPARRLAS